MKPLPDAFWQFGNPKCRRCDLWKSSKHVCITGKGMIPAPIMFVGEAPGKAEAVSGKPFMGRAGKLLDECILRAALPFENLDVHQSTFITNVVKCRPPDNRKPTLQEVSSCACYLTGELNTVKPSIIILLGSTAMDAFGYPGPRGTIVRTSRLLGAKMIGTWHPAYCLRTGQRSRDEMTDHIGLAFKLIEGVYQ